MSFAKSLATHIALKAGIAHGLFKSSPELANVAKSVVASNHAASSPIARRVKLVQLLARQPLSLEALVRKSGVSRRTVFRDLNELENAGIKIELANNKYKAHPGSLAKYLR